MSIEIPKPDPDNILENEESLNDLFSRDPANLSDGDIDKMVDTLRKTRRVWAREQEAKKKQSRKSPEQQKEEANNLSLNDIDL